MNAQQLSVWRAQHAAPAVATMQAPDEQTSFFTGKPYDAASGTFLFKYRSYSPTLARWTSADPSGFPDGANNSNYAPIPTRSMDPLGLVSVDFKGSTVGNASGYPLSYIQDHEAKQMSGLVKGNMDGHWAITSGVVFTGWIVQNLYTTVSVDDSGNNTVPVATVNYYEAWRVQNGQITTINNEYNETASFPSNTHGTFTMTGIAKAVVDAFVFNSNPADWGAQVPYARGLMSTFDCPSWWYTINATSHNITMNWRE